MLVSVLSGRDRGQLAAAAFLAVMLPLVPGLLHYDVVSWILFGIVGAIVVIGTRIVMIEFALNFLTIIVRIITGR